MTVLRRCLAGVIAIALTSCSNSTTDGKPQPDANPLLPQQELLSSSMRQQPVPGWTITVDQLKLPPGTVLRPVGNIADRGVFLGITDEGWFLLGINVTNGQTIFGPVRLGTEDGATDFNCYVNGPPNVLCVRQAAEADLPAAAWVVDTTSGRIVFEGATEARVSSRNHPSLEQIGDYTIAVVEGEGIHGIGPSGELTWFVPGDGILPTEFTREGRDSSVSTLAVQGGHGTADVVFSVVDGRVVKPALPADVELERAVVYPGGFGYGYRPANDFTKERVAFFDDTGKKLGEPASDGALENGSLDLPMVRTKTSRIVLTLDGRQLLQLVPSIPAAKARVIGSRFYIATDADNRFWQQFDLATGEPGKTCEGDALGYQYIASDGEVAVSHTAENPAQGIDLATCDVLWSLAGPAPNEAKEVWKVHTTLVQRTNDRLFSLVAPS